MKHIQNVYIIFMFSDNSNKASQLLYRQVVSCPFFPEGSKGSYSGMSSDKTKLS